MSKKIKLFSIILIIFSIIFSFYGVYATDIDMNLTDEPPTEELPIVNQDDTEIPPTDDELADLLGTDSSQITPSGVDSIEEETLSFSNILSILLITVGVILILLAIAIIIRLK